MVKKQKVITHQAQYLLEPGQQLARTWMGDMLLQVGATPMLAWVEIATKQNITCRNRFRFVLLCTVLSSCKMAGLEALSGATFCQPQLLYVYCHSYWHVCCYCPIMGLTLGYQNMSRCKVNRAALPTGLDMIIAEALHSELQQQ